MTRYRWTEYRSHLALWDDELSTIIGRIYLDTNLMRWTVSVGNPEDPILLDQHLTLDEVMNVMRVLTGSVE